MGLRAIMAGSVVGLALAIAPGSAAAASPGSLPRLGEGDLTWRGAFLLPSGRGERSSFAYGGTALAYNRARDSLFAVGHDHHQRTAEVTTPRPKRAAAPRDLPRARFRQPFADATDGRIAETGGEIDEVGGTGNKIGGQLVHRGRLYGTAYVYYDAEGRQRASHWRRTSTSLKRGGATGLFRIGRVGAGFVSGYMAEIPPVWRRALGGPALTGNCCIPIISRTSFGPAAASFRPRRLGRGRNRATPLVHYPQEHPTLGAWDASWDPDGGVAFNGSTSVTGLVFPRRTRSVLFFGTQGVGPFCYGPGTDDPGLAGTSTPDGATWCYDPDYASSGTHAYPYVSQVWAYDARHLRAVRKGRRPPWRAKPHATWELGLPYGSSRIGGAAYDRRSDRIYVSQQHGDGAEPVIHAFEVEPRARRG